MKPVNEFVQFQANNTQIEELDETTTLKMIYNKLSPSVVHLTKTQKERNKIYDFDIEENMKKIKRSYNTTSQKSTHYKYINEALPLYKTLKTQISMTNRVKYSLKQNLMS